MEPALVLFDDRTARDWAPFALTRPAGELLFGALRLVERVERVFGLPCLGHLTAAHLADFVEPDARPVLDPAALPDDRDLILWCARAIPASATAARRASAGALYRVGGRVAGLRLPAGERPGTAFLDDLAAPEPGETIEIEGRWLDRVWELMLQSPEQAARDLETPGGTSPDALPDGVYARGDHPLFLAEDVALEPPVLFDLRSGPIRLEAGVEVRSGTRLAGPARVGPRSRLLGGSFDAIVTGPFSYLRGEVHHSVVLGYCNKSHDGYLGHAYLGRWVNLGALTTNSDLKNNYHPVRLWTPSGVRDTGELKVGCFLGDHVKTGIGLMINTGTVVGAGSNLYGTVMPPKYVPPFSWGEGESLGPHLLEAFLDSAGRAMSRRGIELDERGRRHLERCWGVGRGE